MRRARRGSRWGLGVSILAVAIFAGLAAGDLYGTHLGYPFVGRQSRFEIGIYTGTSPFDIHPDPRVHNPVITAASIRGVEADFVADPYLVHDGSTWYLFCEVWNHKTHQG